MWAMGEDYMTLFGTQWLSNGIIDYYAITLINSYGRRGQVAYVSCELSGYLMTGKSKKGEELAPRFYNQFQSHWKDTSLIFLPLNIKNTHWLLISADLDESYVYVMDPAPYSDNTQAEELRSNFSMGYQKVKPQSSIKQKVIR